LSQYGDGGNEEGVPNDDGTDAFEDKRGTGKGNRNPDIIINDIFGLEIIELKGKEGKTIKRSSLVLGMVAQNVRGHFVNQ
jgi:hypothetical protein